MKADLMGRLRMVPTGWLNRLPGVRWLAHEAQPEGRLGDGTNMFTTTAQDGLKKTNAARR